MPDNQELKKLLPCPVCAGISLKQYDIKDFQAVNCNDCGCDIPLKSWNTRAKPMQGVYLDRIQKLQEQLTVTQQALDSSAERIRELENAAAINFNDRMKINAELMCEAKSLRKQLDIAVEALKEKQEPDFFYNVDEWDNTYHQEIDATEFFDFRKGAILKLGRLLSLPHKYVIPNPDEECDDLLYFDTLEEAKAALASIKE